MIIGTGLLLSVTTLRVTTTTGRAIRWTNTPEIRKNQLYLEVTQKTRVHYTGEMVRVKRFGQLEKEEVEGTVKSAKL